MLKYVISRHYIILVVFYVSLLLAEVLVLGSVTTLRLTPSNMADVRDDDEVNRSRDSISIFYQCLMLSFRAIGS